MKPVITKQQFLDKIGPEKQKLFEERFGLNLNSDITIEEIFNLIQKEHNLLEGKLKEYEQYFNDDNE